MEISVGNSIFTIPINSIRNSFKVQPSQLVKDTTGKEMVMVYRAAAHTVLLDVVISQKCRERLEHYLLLADKLVGKRLYSGRS